jgi:hypothetical protein
VAKQVLRTPSAGREVTRLTKPARVRYRSAISELEGRGCAAGGYRLAGTDGHDHVLCCRAFYREWRMHLAFPDSGTVLVISVGRHTGDRNPHAELARWLPGLSTTGRRRADKPPCCDDADDPPPVSPELSRLIESITR